MGGVRRTFLLALMVIAMIMAVPLASTAASEVKNWQGITLQKPSTEGEYYIIKNREQLLWWALNGIGKNDGIKLANDIHVQDNGVSVLDNHGLLNSSTNFVTWPKVVADDPTEFQGNGHTIYGIYQKDGCGTASSRGSNDGFKDYLGFLAYTDQCVYFKDFNIADSYIEGNVAGGFIGQKSKNGVRTYMCKYENSSFRGRVIGKRYAGGFVGWYRTDGQDARFYRCFNYASVNSGQPTSRNTDTGAGGLIGYLDICHTAFAKAHTYFDRCVNYGNITCSTNGGNAGGHIGKVWDNNNGNREWRFCFNFGDITKQDKAGLKIAGSGLLGNYQNTNGKAQPKLLCCGNAKPADTGTFIDSCSWNYREHAPIVVQGSKTVLSQKIVSSMKEDNSGASWWANWYGPVTAAIVIVLLTAVTAGVASLAASAASSYSAAWVSSGVNYWLANGLGVSLVHMEAALSAATMASTCTSVALGALGIGAAALGIEGLAVGSCYNLLRMSDSSPIQTAKNDFVYGGGDISRGYYAFDANQMMQSDSIGGEVNTDKSILFKQHIDINDASKNSQLPEIVNGDNDTENKLYFGYDNCNPTPRICNDPNLLKTPNKHTFDEKGECTYCHVTEQPLNPIYKADNKTVDYYEIKNIGNLNYLAAVFNGEEGDEKYQTYKNATFKLINDIKAPDNMVWKPIGTDMSSGSTSTESTTEDTFHPFEGTFDGQGHTISGLRTSQYANYAGLFGELYSTSTDDNPTHTTIKNLRLSDCTFQGEIAGGIVGAVAKKECSSEVRIEQVAVDNNVIVASTGKRDLPCAGGFIGSYYVSNRMGNYGLPMSVDRCYSNASVLSDGGKATSGAYIGRKNAEVSLLSGSKGMFNHCYFAGVCNGDLVGNIASINNTFYHSFAVGNKEALFYDRTTAVNQCEVSQYFTRRQVENGRMAYALMASSHTADGNYLFKQGNGYPEFDESKVPSLYDVSIWLDNFTSSTSSIIGDTIINVNDTNKLKAPLAFAGRSFDKARLYYQADEKSEVTKADNVNDFSALYDKAKAGGTYYIGIENVDYQDILSVNNSYEWRGIPTLGGYKTAKLLADVSLTADNAYTINDAPITLDGNFHNVITDRAIVADKTRQTEMHSHYKDSINIKNMYVYGDTLCKNTACAKLNLENIIMRYNDPAVFFNFNYMPSSKEDKNRAENWKNVVAISPDSTRMFLFENKSSWSGQSPKASVISADALTTAYSNRLENAGYDISTTRYKDNYASLVERLNAMYPDWQNVFGFRIVEGYYPKVASRFGFAADPDKKVYTVKLYRQQDGEEDGSVMMNYDGNRVLKLSTDGSVYDGYAVAIPAGHFVVLPVTKAELGDNFDNLCANVITKDGYAKNIVLDDAQENGFAYPSCLAEDVTIHADRAEYKRSIYRDGLHETICLPFAFNTLEFDEKALSDNDSLNICFLNPNAGGVDKANNVVRLTSVLSYLNNKYESPDYDPTKDEAENKFVAGVPYLISLTCKDNTDGKSAVTFVGSDVTLLRTPSDVVAPLYGSFKKVAASEVANGNKMMVLGVFDGENGTKVEKFVKVKDTYRLKPYRAYLALSSAQAARAMSLVIDGKGATTGISGIHADRSANDGKLYDLSGRRIGKSGANDVYIKNGKKIINLK